eukprot:613974-Alexandrium_andersonii.AAC.1
MCSPVRSKSLAEIRELAVAVGLSKAALPVHSLQPTGTSARRSSGRTAGSAASCWGSSSAG